MRRVFKKAPLAVHRALDAQQQLVDRPDERPQLAGHARQGQRRQVERAAPFNGRPCAVHFAKRPTHHHAGQRGQQQEQDGHNEEPAPEAVKRLGAQIALRRGQLHLHPPAGVGDRIHAPVGAARRAVQIAVPEVRIQRLDGRFRRLQQRLAVGQRPHLEGGPVAVEVAGRRQSEALGRRHAAQQADRQGHQDLVRPIVQSLVPHARLGARRFELLQGKDKYPGQRQRQQQRDRQLLAQGLHSPASMR
ncbi:hypothetical protein D3C87_1336680 [compost metagenome]